MANDQKRLRKRLQTDFFLKRNGFTTITTKKVQNSK